MINKEQYQTNTQNSFLKALGPHKIDSSGESFSGVILINQDSLSEINEIETQKYLIKEIHINHQDC